MKSQNVILYPSKKKLLALLAIPILLVIACIANLLIYHQLVYILFNSAALLFFTWMGVIFVYRLLVPFPILIINDEGIQSYQTHRQHAPVTVKWEEIAVIQRSRILLYTYFRVTLSPEGMQAFLSRKTHLNRFSTFFLQRRAARPQPVIILAQLILPISVEQLIAQIQLSDQAQIEQNHIFIRN